MHIRKARRCKAAAFTGDSLRAQIRKKEPEQSDCCSGSAGNNPDWCQRASALSDQIRRFWDSSQPTWEKKKREKKGLNNRHLCGSQSYKRAFTLSISEAHLKVPGDKALVLTAWVQARIIPFSNCGLCDEPVKPAWSDLYLRLFFFFFF